jgi:CelD/BcsL family acetyltransferase involved in cellulose biosynthesis
LESSLLSVSRAEGLVPVKPEWDDLLARSPADTVFLTWEWQDLWWRVLGAPAGVEPRILAVRAGDSLVGVAPLCREGSTFHFAGGEEIADFLDVLALPGHEPAVAAAVLDYLADQPWELVDLRNLRQDAAALAYLRPEAERRGLRVEVEQEDVSPWLKLPATWEEYQQSLSKKDRHELRRKLRRLHSSGEVRWYAADDPSTRMADVADFVRLLRLSAEAKAAFMTPEMVGWFDAIVERFAPTGELKLYFLELDGLRVASAVLFDYRDRYLLYNSGYDPEYARLSVGLALKAYCIHDAIAAGREVFDFLQGSEPYKYDLGAVDAPIFRMRITRSRPYV